MTSKNLGKTSRKANWISSLPPGKVFQTGWQLLKGEESKSWDDRNIMDSLVRRQQNKGNQARNGYQGTTTTLFACRSQSFEGRGAIECVCACVRGCVGEWVGVWLCGWVCRCVGGWVCVCVWKGKSKKFYFWSEDKCVHPYRAWIREPWHIDRTFRIDNWCELIHVERTESRQDFHEGRLR